MYHIVFNADENYLKYAAVLMTSIVRHTNTAQSAAVSATRERERERERDGAAISEASKNAHATQNSLENAANATFHHAQQFLRQDGVKENPENFSHSQQLLKQNSAKENNATFPHAQQLLKQDENSANSSQNPRLDRAHALPHLPPLAKCDRISNADIAALAVNLPNEPYHFHILSDFVSENSRKKLENLAFELSKIYPCAISTHIADDSIFQGTIKWGFEDSQNYLAYYRLLLARFLPENADKCLYLDTDTLALCDVRELFMLDLKGKVLASNSAAVQPCVMGDILEPFDSGKKAFEMQKVPYYICSALLLVNLHEWKAQDIEARSLNFLRTYKTHYADQDAINAVLDGNLLVLPPEYDLLLFQAPAFLRDESYGYKDELIETLKHLKIGHFNGPAHPWLPKYRYLHDDFLPLDTPYRDKWWEIALQTPIFGDDLREVKARLDTDIAYSLNNYAKALAERLKPINAEIQALKEEVKSLKERNFKSFIKHKIVFNLIQKPLKSLKRKIKGV